MQLLLIFIFYKKFKYFFNLALINVISLNWVKNASLFLCLDKYVVTQESEIKTKKDLIENLKNNGLNILHGFGSLNKGLNRWFDATIQVNRKKILLIKLAS